MDIESRSLSGIIAQTSSMKTSGTRTAALRTVSASSVTKMLHHERTRPPSFLIRYGGGDASLIIVFSLNSPWGNSEFRGPVRRLESSRCLIGSRGVRFFIVRAQWSRRNAADKDRRRERPFGHAELTTEALLLDTRNFNERSFFARQPAISSAVLLLRSLCTPMRLECNRDTEHGSQLGLD